MEPFADLSRDGSNAWFARGMAEELMVALSQIKEIIVVSPGQGAPTSPAGLPHLHSNFHTLEGTIRVQGDKLRVTARLIEKGSGSHLWSDRFDADLGDIFSVQDEITRQVALSVQVKLADGASAHLWEGQTRSLKAWEKMVEGRVRFLAFNREDNLRATEALAAAIDIDPTYTAAMVHLGLCYWWHARFDLRVDLEVALGRAEAMVARARSIRPDIGNAFALDALIAVSRDDHAGAIRLSRFAHDKVPGDSHTAGICSMVSNYAGAHAQSRSMAQQAIRLSPRYSAWFTYYLSLSHLWQADIETGTRLAEEYLHREFGDPYAYVLLVLAAGLAGDAARAKSVAMDLTMRFPTFCLRNLRWSEHYAEPVKMQRLMEIMRNAGLRE